MNKNSTLKNTYALTLGRTATLSLAEIFCVLGKREGVEWLVVSPGVVVVTLSEPLKDPQGFLDQLGGTIKITTIEEVMEVSDVDNFGETLKSFLLPSKIAREYLVHREGKINFGISWYATQKYSKKIEKDLGKYLKRWGLTTKTYLKNQNRSSRYVALTPKEKNLRSVAVTKNHLLEKGAELALVVDRKRFYLGRTIAVQDFEYYSKRDYGRPARDTHTGMLPPKIAQIMVNLSQITKKEKLLDPFMGVGTVLQEALLRGIEVYGTDTDQRMVTKTSRNLKWLKIKYPFKASYHLNKSDARKIAGIIPPHSIRAIVTEGTLGPIFNHAPSEQEREKVFLTLKTLYLRAFEAFNEVLERGGRLVITLPFYLDQEKKPALFPFLDDLLTIGYRRYDPFSQIIADKSDLSLSKRQTILYRRPQQNVGREIIILQRSQDGTR